MTPGSAPLQQILLQRIRTHGPITFADFMRECLYHPQFGYYSRPQHSRFADYYTSVDVHPIFARLLARQLAEMWRILGAPPDFLVVEAAAATGKLAAQFLDFASRQLPDFFSALRYVAVEPSAARRAAHQAALQSHIAAGRFSSASALPPRVPAGCIFSNELLDALPVHRVICLRGQLHEIYVSAQGQTLRLQTGPLSSPEIAAYFERQSVSLREGQQAEAGLEACRWIETAGQALERGFLLTIDYGHEASELFSERHNRGTVLAYSRHTVTEDLLRSPGEQDLTAHVNFTALDVWGKKSGLRRSGLVTQTRFLAALGRPNLFADLCDPGATAVETIRARLLLKTLLSPEGMGETFRVLIQHKGIPSPALTGLQPL